MLCAGAAAFAEAVPMRLGAPAQPLPVDADATMPHPYRWALDQFRATSAGGMLRALAEIVRFDSPSWLAEIDVPTVVVIPARDRLISPKHQHWMASQIRDAYVVTVDAGHACCTLQHQAFIPGLRSAVESVLTHAAWPARVRRNFPVAAS